MYADMKGYSRARAASLQSDVCECGNTFHRHSTCSPLSDLNLNS